MSLFPLRRVVGTLLFAATISLSSGPAFAQNANARIKGSVTDPSGAVVPGAAVVATNTATGVKTITKSSNDGSYLFPQLTVGTYNITITAEGFKSFTATGIVLNIDQEYVEPAKLALGSTSETLEVAADPVQVNTTDMQLSNIVDSSEMVELPLVGRNFTGLETILPGVQLSSDRFGTYSVSGAQTQQSEFLVNGADTNDIALNTLALAPNIDAIDQFNLIDGPLNAEYDRNSGGIVSATIKQGTNHIHGDIFEFYRDTFLDTLSYFQKSATTGTGTLSPYHQNIFGGTIGAPIIKDKLFAFFAYQGTKQRTPGNGSSSLYTTSNLSGNFTADNGPANSGVPCSATATTAACGWGAYAGSPIPSSITIPGCSTAGETWAQCAYALGGVFPATTFNKISTALVNKYIPPTDINSGTYGYLFPGANTTTANQEIGRIDYALNPKNQFTFVGIYQKSNATSVLPFTGASVPGFGEIDTTTIQQYTFDYVHQFSASLVNDFAAHWTRFNYQAVVPQNVVSPSSLGFSIIPQNEAAASVPTISVSGVNTNFTLGFSTNGPQPRIDQVYQLDDSLSKTFGHHQLKFGYDGRRFNVSNPFNANNSGSYGFNTNSTYTTGDGALDFLLGVPQSYAQGSGATIQADAFLNYFYAQDTWKLTNSFTLDYGMGYSIDTPLENHQYNGEAIICFIPGQQSTVFSNAPVGINYPGDKGCSNSAQATTRHTEFGPRIGFAWAPDLGKFSGSPGKFSIRGGFGLYYNRTEEETSLQTLESPPFGTATGGAADFGGSPQFANPFADINGGGAEANKFPFVFPVKGQAIPSSDYSPYYYFSTYGPSFRAPYAENFQLTIEREFPARVVARVSYVGSLAHRNQITYEGNYTTAAGHAACAAGSEYSPTYGGTISCTANRANQNYYFPQNTAAGSIYAPTGAPGFTNVGVVGSEGSSNYNALQASVEKAVTHGLFFQLSYTYSHAMDNGSNFENSGFGGSARGYNQYQPSLNYGDSAYDARQHLVFSPIYISPKLKGEWYAPLNLALSGWEITGIMTVATGFPYDISYGGSSSDSLYCAANGAFYACPDVPNQTAPLIKYNPRAPRNTNNGSVQYISKTSFANEAIGTFGTLHRDPFHGPGVNNTNVILAKNFPLGADGVRRLQIRMETDNVFNHTQFTNPSSTWTDGSNSTFGQITGTQAARLSQLGAKFYF